MTGMREAIYAHHHGLTQADFAEALRVAMTDPEGWVAYIQSQNATKH